MRGRFSLLRGDDTITALASRFLESSANSSLTRRRTVQLWNRYASTASKTISARSGPQKPINGRSNRRAPRDKLAERDFFFDVLNVSATRRDAKQYLARFDAKSKTKQHGLSPKPKERALASPQRSGVNLGPLYSPTAAIEKSPLFEQSERSRLLVPKVDKKLMHLALVSIRILDLVEDRALDSIALTLSQLVRLDMRIAITFDLSRFMTGRSLNIQEYKSECEKQSQRLVKVLNRYNRAGSCYIDSSLGIREEEADRTSELQKLDIVIGAPVADALKRCCIPIIPPIAYTSTVRAVPARRSEVMYALTRALSGLVDFSGSAFIPPKDATLSLDRIIMIDPIGGVPSLQREDGAHVFINLEQEFKDILHELSSTPTVHREAVGQHLENLSTVKECLSILPPTTSALVISPEEAANSSRPTENDSDPATIRTRRQKNPLIHNLLTNRSVISPSLPAARLTQPLEAPESAPRPPSHSTLVKRGMPLKIIPDPRQTPWVPPSSGKTDLTLENNPNINFPRLLALIEDSFRRPLDVKHYLSRIQNRIAGIIIAGEYEGGAILTWESPSGSNGDPTRLVPYLDKFAVLQKAQGNAGVADIVFQAMVRSCFPNGVCWRSRSNNPVNKWYFERSSGSWKLPDDQWTMFWTLPGEDLVLDQRRWSDYVAVCEAVVPSWADGKRAD
ncbi:Amino-acid acetyltransferase, mitochondrial [Elsinoe australis]|uniref:Amino-acid acetyltransferase, mitochondrial n=1 Tax=Elsinoe australis TaxID=40998 RepID=A0A2P7YQ92_9PEZI|nr:Amino-acid acetyltransferase, mitochondrial [Elsinoe australis]